MQAAGYRARLPCELVSDPYKLPSRTTAPRRRWPSGGGHALRRSLEQLHNLRPYEPDYFVIEPAPDARVTVFRLIEDDAG
jgi:hypothetical protein